MQRIKLAMMGLFVLFLWSCEQEDNSPGTPNLDFDFTTGLEEWIGDFADYPVGEEEFYELDFGYATLPDPLDPTTGAIRQVGHNRSDDLFMYIKHKVEGLLPNQTYELTFAIEIATDAAQNSVGIGGSPAESVTVKAGATTVEPQKVNDGNGFYLMNIDKGNQVQSGVDMVSIGDFSNETDEFVYKLKSISTETPFLITTDNSGTIWLVIGTDSGFEGRTEIYYNKISVEIEKQ